MTDEKSLRVRLGPLHGELKEEAAELTGHVSLNTYIVQLLTSHPDRKRKPKKRAKAR